MSIFIQIASYRDPELALTIEDAILRANKPEELRFVVCWQYHPKDDFTNSQRELFSKTKTIEVIDIDISTKPFLGTCWARNQIQQLYDNEDYTLQLDSHMRFVEGWDSELIDMLHLLQKDGYKKPLITSYATSFDPDNDPEGRLDELWRMDFDRFAPEGWLATAPSVIPNHKLLTKPVPARFYSAHFAFAEGTFAKEVQHDPQFYFHGEEPSIAVRAFTHGYDLFHPHKMICWHEYGRDNKKKHWDDDKKWEAKNKQAHLRYRQLFGMDGEPMVDLFPYGFGTERTLEEYKSYSGIDMTNRKIQQYTKDRYSPPNPTYYDEVAYELSFFEFFRHCLDIHTSSLTKEDYDFWVVSFEDESGQIVSPRQDTDEGEIKHLLDLSKKDGGWIRLWRQYEGKPPHKIVVWPHSKSDEWCDRMEFKISN
jgi:hypothetical protein